jgi:pilus assembly protein CpaC
LPGLSRIPFIGLLFGTRERRDQEEEGLIVITPNVVESLDAQGRDKLDRALAKYRGYWGEERTKVGDGEPANRTPHKRAAGAPFH